MVGIVTKGKILRNDLELYDGKSFTASRKDQTGGTISGLRVGNSVDVLSVYGDGKTYNDRTIQDALNAIGTANVTLDFTPGTWEIENDLTIPDTVNIHVFRGAVFNVASGKTLTINGDITAGLYQIFSGAGIATGTFNAYGISPKWWGAVGDGVTDDSVAIQSAIDKLEANGIPGIIILGDNHAIDTKITINKPGIRLLGIGSSSSHDVVGNPGPGTILKWTGAAGGTVMEIAPIEGAGNRRLDGIHLDGFSINSNGVAAKGLVIKSARKSYFDVSVFESTDTDIELGVVTTLGEATDIQENIFNIVARNINAGGDCLRLTGDTSANTSMNLFEVVSIVHKNGIGIVEENADNNTWLSTRVFRASGGTGNGIEWQGGASAIEAARRENFIRLSSTGPIVVKGTPAYTAPSTNINILWIDDGNGTPDPTIETGASAFFGTHEGVRENFLGAKVALGDNQTNAKTAFANRGNETVRIYNASSNHVKLENGTEEWGIRIDGANGNLFLDRASGTGVINTDTDFHRAATRILTTRQTGWTDQTATASRADLGASPTVAQLASAFRALYDDLKAHGLIGN